MIFSTLCIICNRLNIEHEPFRVEIRPNDKGIYKVCCPKGHEFNIDIALHHFQQLFENALDALFDKYHIESISSFTSSYERFLEFFIRVVLISRGVKQDEFTKTWKLVSRQSERQIGAFVLLYLQEFGKEPKLLSNKNVELRNKVIHKGYFPTKDECVKYGDNVLSFIRGVLNDLSSVKLYEKELTRIVNDTTEFDIDSIQMTFYAYQIFPINRSMNKTEEFLVSDFLEQRARLKTKHNTLYV